MKILLYSADYKSADQLEDKISCTFLGYEILLCRTVAQLDAALRSEFIFSAVILLVSAREELLEMLTIQRMLDKFRIIIVLPDNSADLVRFALKLYPRYLTDAGESFSTIIEVLKKIFAASSSSGDYNINCH